jgi:drug/metabolite transporter (DMT)-like permease
VRRSVVTNAGLVLGVTSAATFGTSGSFAASLIRAGWTPAAAVTARVVIATLLLTPAALSRLRFQPLTRPAVRAIALYGIAAVAGAQLCYFNAVAHLSVAVALLLEYSGILLVVLWGWARHGHRPRRLTVLGGLAAVTGLIMVLDLIGSHRIDAVGVLWGLGAAVGLAAYFVLSARGPGMGSPLVVAWGGLAVGAVALGAAGAAGAIRLRADRRDVTLLHHQVSWLVPVLGLSIVAAVVAYLAGIVAARLLGAKLASFVGLTEVLFAVVFAWLLLGQHLDGMQIAGGALVVAGIALVRFDEVSAVPPPAPGPAAPGAAPNEPIGRP